ncbi:alpha/beta hydrolase family esterase [Streptomyces violaceusniger]|uniref:Poly(3-hydroxyalkanoate) depolymerase n=1 Tax=Streptomyces violaceusniger (strain Tu 4113) TaxID=653045 RepID=G2P4X9_STRV4|nr:PHB depolymerase family esterase [Streptomyces violaceusniger]AEM84156.1 poly(3-hydroxyalkanoate) depolymerase [Streptomyces violaceusniger Tu 4113]
MLQRLPHIRLAHVLTAAAAAAVALPIAVAAPADAQEAVRSAGPRCAPAASGLTTVSVASAGATYPATVYVPRGYTGRHPVPLVLNLHGSGSNGSDQLIISDMQRAADENGFLVAVPNGGTPVPGPREGYTWVLPGVPDSSGRLPAPDARDDVRFLSDTISAVSDGFCMAPRRVYATGFSGGARMASLLACELADRIAAVAPVAGLRAGGPDAADPTRPAAGGCTPSRSVPVLAFHGQQDMANPYDGGGPAYWQYSVPAAFDRWAELDGCRVGPRDTRLTEHVTLSAYRACRRGADVSMYVIADGGHTWPGSPYPDAFPGLGKVSTEVNATDVMWRFFEQHPLRHGSAAGVR